MTDDLLGDFAADMAAEFGLDGKAISATYSPADVLIESFSLHIMPVGLVDIDQYIDTNIFADQMDVRIPHSELVAGGVTSPVASLDGATADIITRSDHNGETETWYVRGGRLDPRTEIWTLKLEKEMRIVPR